MQSLDTHALVMNAFIVVAMPLVILVNLRGAARTSPMHNYLWRENPNLMRVMLVILGAVMLFSVIDILAHKGVISPLMREMLSMLVGVPFLFLSLATIVLAAICMVRLIRDWRAGRLGA